MSSHCNCDVKSGLRLHPAEECRYDVVSPGEVVLRLGPGEGRVRTARVLKASEDGDEYNMARGSRRAFGRRTVVVIVLIRDEVRLLIEDCIL